MSSLESIYLQQLAAITVILLLIGYAVAVAATGIQLIIKDARRARLNRPTLLRPRRDATLADLKIIITKSA